MIPPAEIQQKARKEGVRDTQVEKDYILSWILIGIAHSDVLSENLAFKGGTVLKKCYFESYRHSEDLDFTLLDNAISVEAIKAAFESSFELVREEANISLSISDFGEHETGNINFFIGYTGPLGGTGKRVKIDISNELLKFEVETKSLFATYSDHIDSALKCYSLPEVLTEKLRSLLSRQQPRDLYDLWYLSEYEKLEMSDYVAEFEEKARHKSLKPENLEQRIALLLPSFKSRWEKSIRGQIKNLPPFEQVVRELGRHFRKFPK
jgi:predicted nucleotidyltransferase component of viral defense system